MSLSQEEIEAVRAYSGPAYRRINAFLRGDDPGDDVLRQTVELLDNAVANSRLESPRTLYRGIGEPGATEWRGRGLRIGQKRTDPAFMSTTSDPVVANLFTDLPPDGLILRIEAAAGTAALDLTALSEYPHEAEFAPTRDDRQGAGL